MGNGLTPGPVNDLGDPIVIDDGTLARTESPAPGPIGLDSTTGGPTKPSMADQIVSFPRQRMGQKYGDGECFTLADQSLRNAGAKSAADFSKVTPHADYVWGASVKLSDLKPGDVIQFRDYRYDRKIEKNNPDGSGSTDTDFEKRPHHTAVVEQVDGDGVVTVLEQNSPEGSPIVRSKLFFTSSTSKSGHTTTTIKVTGKFWFYRPQAR